MAEEKSMMKKEKALHGIYEQHILTDVGARSVYKNGKRVGYCINILINYYRGLPLSCIDSIELWVDGEQVRPEDITCQTNGKEYPYLKLLSDDMETDTYWLFGDYMRLTIAKEGGITPGAHEVRIRLGTRRSYTPTLVSECTKIITFA